MFAKFENILISCLFAVVCIFLSTSVISAQCVFIGNACQPTDTCCQVTGQARACINGFCRVSTTTPVPRLDAYRQRGYLAQGHLDKIVVRHTRVLGERVVHPVVVSVRSVRRAQ